MGEYAKRKSDGQMFTYDWEDVLPYVNDKELKTRLQAYAPEECNEVAA